jgi:sugar/nucleoside kinase (ribokinase family)
MFDGHESGASIEAMRQFSRARTILDAGSLRAGTRELAARVEFVVASERFARQLTGLPNREGRDDRATAIAAVSALNRRPCVITLGRAGLIHGTAERWDHLPACPVTALDTTAAGDAFHGALAFGVMSGLDWLQTLRLASTTAALSVQSLGGRRSFPSLARVRAALADDRDTRNSR